MLVFEKLFLQKNVPLELLCLNDKPVYRAEGFGGRPLKNWPVVDFFRQYAAGEHEAALGNFVTWYIEQFKRQSYLPKKVGGMYGGTLYHVIKRQHEEANRPFNVHQGMMSSSIVKRAVTIRVEQRLGFFVSMMNNGFCPELSDHPIAGICRGSMIVLQEGHHRAAAFIALDKRNLPEMLVFPERVGLYLYRSMRYFFRAQRFLKKVHGKPG